MLRTLKIRSLTFNLRPPAILFPNKGPRKYDTDVQSGEWRVESGEWRVEGGEWRVESGEWRVESGEWRGEWRVERGEERGEWRVERRAESGEESGEWRVQGAGSNRAYRQRDAKKANIHHDRGEETVPLKLWHSVGPVWKTNSVPLTSDVLHSEPADGNRKNKL